MVVGDIDHAKMTAVGWVGGQGGDGDVGAGVLVLLEHALVIHFVDVVAGEDDHVLWLLGANGIDVLIDGVGRPHVPVLADPLHGGQNLDELSDFSAEDVPAFADLAIERKRLVLGQDINAAQSGVDAVGKRDVDDAVDAAKGDGRLGAVAGQRIEAFASSSREQDPERIFHRSTAIAAP